MNLPAYIKRVGHKAAAKKFGVSEATVKAWRWGYRRPRPESAFRIVAATDGVVTLAGIYSPNSHPPAHLPQHVPAVGGADDAHDVTARAVVPIT